MPREVFGDGFHFLPRSEILHFGEIRQLVRIFRRFGLRKIRLTGGEPLLRRELPRLVSMLAHDEGYVPEAGAEVDDLEVALTTNGSFLPELAGPLAEAGLGRVTVSLDSLDPAVFARMNDTRVPVARVLAGIEAAAAAGLRPVKVNMVVKRGVNEDGVVPMARHFRGTGQIVRFIEYMDVGNSNGWRLDDVVPADEIIAAVDAVYPIEALPPDYPGEVATRWRYRDGAGEIGVIASVSRPFCGDCTRARISADGLLYTCLFASTGHDLRQLLRGGASDDTLDETLAGIWRRRDDRYSELRSAETVGLRKVEMSYIGG
jgi:cyclic pyranopterin phosphate synthase